MGLNCGIVGLPNVGKSTIFSALTASKAEIASYPFSTVGLNVGIIDVPDSRLDALTELFKPKRRVPATVEFVDIAGLVKGASRGEGLGNQFLSHIRNVGIIAHVVRCFVNPDIVHVSDVLDPKSDIETIEIELALADLESVDRKLEKLVKQLKVSDKAQVKLAETQASVLERVRPVLEQGGSARTVNLSDEERAAIADLQLITMKQQIFVCNVDETGLAPDNPLVAAVRGKAVAEGAEVVVICGKYESELVELGNQEKTDFLREIGLRESGLTSLIRGVYRQLGLRTFLTAGEDECRAWTFKDGALAPEAAGIIHTDFQRGFIKAEVYAFDDLVELGSEQKVKIAGKYRTEGREYRVRDGDVIFFKFNV